MADAGGREGKIRMPVNVVLEKIFRENARSSRAVVPWGDFINTALYDENLGYYRRADKLRVGGDGADFYTSASLKNRVFSELVENAARTLATRSGFDFDSLEFYEIGAEGDRRIIENSRAAKLGDKIEIPPKAIVVSNELLDARPFSRFKFCGGKWRKGFVEISKGADGFSAAEVFGEPEKFELGALAKYFPRAKVEGFRIDISFDALGLFEKICSAPWRGILIFADYFRTAAELSELPNGTARGYFKHTDRADILRDAGETDITFSPCSDMLRDIAAKCGLQNFSDERQEKFFVKNAGETMRKIAQSPDPFDPRKRELVQLLSPVHMGAAFRVISAVRK